MYSWMRFTWQSNIESGSTASGVPRRAYCSAMTWTSRSLLARLTARHFSTKAASSASGTEAPQLVEVGHPLLADRLA